MKERIYTDIICKGFCNFYKEGKEELLCGTYKFLFRNLTSRELSSLLKLTGASCRNASPDFSKDREIEKLVCRKCDFFADGCDYRESGSHPPCGGYFIIEQLLE